MNSLLAKWKRDQGGGLPLSFRMELALRYLMDLTYARVYLLGKRLKIGRMPRIRKKPLIKNHGRLLIGHNFFLNSQFASSHIVVLPGGEIVIGDQVIINFGAAISSQSRISIGHRCHIGPHVMIMDTNYHAIQKDNRESGSGKRSDIIIEDDVWIASRVTILPGTKIGRGSVVSSGSVVSGIIPPDVVVAGNPAVVVKTTGGTAAPRQDAESRPAPIRQETPAEAGTAAKVVRLVAETFYVPGEVSMEASADEIPGWDSLGGLRLMAAIERTFGIAIAPADINRVSSVAGIVALLGEYLAARSPQNEPPAAPGTAPQSAAPAAVATDNMPKEKLRIALLRNCTLEPLVPVLGARVAKLGFAADFYLGDFDAIAADVLNPASAFHAYNADFIIMTNWLELLAPKLVRSFLSVMDQTDAEIEKVIRQLKLMLTGIREKSSAPVLVNNFPLIFAPTLGILDSQQAGRQQSCLAALNRAIVEMCATFDNVFVADYQQTAALMGAEHFYSEKLWQAGKIPFTDEGFAALADLYCRFLRALRGKTKKCLVLDCDNTLWGGIVGDEGPHGIVLGGGFPGACFVNFQQEILGLHDRGVILALCSKNNEADVLEALRSNEHCLLKEQHLAIWEINWQDKATNIRNIAQTLRIGLDSLVFVDDSRFECEMVRSMLPEVEVIQVPEQPERMAGLLTGSGLFDSLNFTAEDKVKNSMYQAEARRTRILESATSLEEYLYTVELRADICLADESVIERVAQLTQKTNQFNLTTRRYSEDDIRRFATAKDSAVFYLKVADKVADFGVVGAAIVRFAPDHAVIDTFLMSCRVLGRGIESTFLHQILQFIVRAKGVTAVHASFKPTAKNGQVADFYPKHGFTSTDQQNFVCRLDGALFSPPGWVNVGHHLLSAR